MKNPWDNIDLEKVKKRMEAEIALTKECKSVTPETAVDLLVRINEVCDIEMAHIRADEVLCTLLRNLGYNDIIDVYENIDKLYSY